LIDAGTLSTGHGKVLLTEPDHCRRRELARRAAAGGWSIRALEAESHDKRIPMRDQPSHIQIR